MGIVRRVPRVPGGLALALAAGWLVGCSTTLASPPNLYPAGSDPFKDVPLAHRNNQVPLIFVTDRLPESDSGQGTVYGFRRSRSLGFGETTAQFGVGPLPWETFAAESIKTERQVDLTLKIVATKEVGRLPESPCLVEESDGRLSEVRDVAAERQAEAKFLASVKAALEQGKRRDVYVYVHGYYDTFEKSAMVLAELWHFLGRDGVPLLYSWPAGSGGLSGHAYARESADFTTYHFRNFLKLLGSSPDLERVHIIAHSRGADVVLGALHDLLLSGGSNTDRLRRELKLDTVVLAAPDLDTDSFRLRLYADSLRYVPRRLVIYTGKDDGAGGTAGWFLGSVTRLGDLREGEYPPGIPESALKSPQLQVIECSITEASTYDCFYTHPAVLSDLILVLRDRKDPGAENGRPLNRQPNQFWYIYNGYLRSAAPAATSPAAPPPK